MYLKMFLRPISVLMYLTILPTTAFPGVYKCLDTNGKVFYQDKPCRELTSTGLSPALSKLAPQNQERRLLWKVSSGEKAFYIMGALSYGTADMYPPPESVMDIFSSTSALVIVNQLDAGEPILSNPVAVSKGQYAGDTTLEAHIKPAVWERVLTLAKELEVPEEILAAQKPWVAAFTLKNAAIKKANLDEKMSVDKMFVKAVNTQKPIIEIDSVTKQAEMYNAMSDAEQEQILVRALHEADPKNAYFEALVDAWKNGDVNGIENAQRTLSEGLSKTGMSVEGKIGQQNTSLVTKLSEMIEDGRTYFVVVNVQRLTGEKGLIKQLQSKGFTLSQISG